MTDITDIKRRLHERAAEVAEFLLPGGIRQGREWAVGSVQGEKGESLKVCIAGGKAGTWSDFADGDGGDLLDLWMAVKGVTLVETLDHARGWLGMESVRFEKREKTYRRPEMPKASRPKSAVLEYLTGERKLSADAIRAYRVGEADRTITLVSLLPSGELAAVKYLGIDRDAKGKKITRVEAGCEPVLFGWQAVTNTNGRECTITEGEIDAMTAWDYRCPNPLSVPFGGGKGAKQQWIESELERLAQFEVIYLALDMDAEGEAGAEEIASRLGRHRCRRVKLPHKDMNECAKAGIPTEEIKRAFDAAGTLDPPELTRAGAYLDEVISLFWPKQGEVVGYGLPWEKTADKVRFRPGELTLWTGATGSGKSQLLSHCLVAMGEQGARVCIASLEMMPAQLLKRAVKQAGNTDRAPEPYIREIVGWLDEWMWVFGQVGKAGVTRILEVFEYARCRYGCDVFVIDSLMRLGVGSEDYEGQEKAVFAIVSWAVEKGVHVHLVAHARKENRQNGHSTVPDSEDVKGTSEIASNAANILGVWRNRKHEDKIREAQSKADKGDFSADTELRGLRDMPGVMLNIAKQRNGDFEGKIGLWFNHETYQYRSAQDSKNGWKYLPVDMERVA